MHALLIGLISGYFFVACAPVHWSGAMLVQLICSCLLALLLRHALNGFESQCRGTLRLLSGTAKWVLNLLGGASLSAALLANFLHDWQSHVVAESPAGFRCEPATESELIRLEVLGLPSRTLDGSRFDARVVSIRPGCHALLGKRLRVSWPAATWPVAGQRILAEARFRFVRGSVSPGAFDHELNLARRGIRISAYLSRTLGVSDPGWFASGVLPTGVSSFSPRSLSLSMARTRLTVRRSLEALPLENRGVLLALFSGDSALMPRETWELLQATGTVHLMVISGLHVGLVGLCLLFIVRTLSKLLLRVSNTVKTGKVARRIEVLCASVLLMIYVTFTGAGVAAVRALVMLVVVFFAWSSGRHIAAPALLIAVFVAVVLHEPGAGLSPGFWLSFGLVSWLILTSASTVDGVSPVSGTRFWKLIWDRSRSLLGLHVGCSLILLPGLAWLGLPVAIVAPIANLFAVPLVTLVLVPLILSGGLLLPVSASVSARVFFAADNLASQLLTGLEWLGSTLPAAELPVLTGMGYLAVAILLFVALLPSSGVMRLSAIAMLLLTGWNLVATPQPKVIPLGEFSLQLLDVGQGLAIVIQTRNQTYLYDTGARFPSGFNFADAVIDPALRAKSISRLDALFISHHDIDHAGGLARIIQLYQPARLVGGVVERACNPAGEPLAWAEDRVRFSVLQHVSGATSNDRSCVLVIRGRTSTAVIAGDIEVEAETWLLPQLPELIDVLVVPHHGSRTSSSPEFVAALQPKFALVSAGFDNRFGHPHADVVARYERLGAKVLTTAELGTIHWRSSLEFPVSGARGPEWSSAERYRSAREQRQWRWQLGAGLLR